MNSRFVTSMGSAFQILTFVAVVVVAPLTTSLALPRSPPRKRDATRAARGKTIKIDNHGIHGAWIATP